MLTNSRKCFRLCVSKYKAITMFEVLLNYTDEDHYLRCILLAPVDASTFPFEQRSTMVYMVWPQSSDGQSGLRLQTRLTGPFRSLD
jgi:hypothetical protein